MTGPRKARVEFLLKLVRNPAMSKNDKVRALAELGRIKALEERERQDAKKEPQGGIRVDFAGRDLDPIARSQRQLAEERRQGGDPFWDLQRYEEEVRARQQGRTVEETVKVVPPDATTWNW